MEDDVDELTQLVLLNAIYFKGRAIILFSNILFHPRNFTYNFSAQWKTAFNPTDTFSSTFNSPLSGSVNTSFMVLDTKAKLLERKDLGLTLL